MRELGSGKPERVHGDSDQAERNDKCAADRNDKCATGHDKCATVTASELDRECVRELEGSKEMMSIWPVSSRHEAAVYLVQCTWCASWLGRRVVCEVEGSWLGRILCIVYKVFGQKIPLVPA